MRRVVSTRAVFFLGPCRRDGGLQALVAFPETGPLESLRRFLAVADTVREWALKVDYPASDYDDAERVREEIVALAPWLSPIEGLGLAWYAWSHANFASELDGAFGSLEEALQWVESAAILDIRHG